MDTENFTICLLFPFRKDSLILNKLCRDYPVKLITTPYIESDELRSSRGLHNGRNAIRSPEPFIEASSIEHWTSCNAVVGMDIPSHPEVLFPNLEWFQGVSAGFDHIDSAALKMMGVVQTNARGIASPSISEFVFARVLQIWKNLRELDAQQDEQIWKVRFGTQAHGKTIGIVGLGSIGREVAIKARAFGMKIFATRKSALPTSVDQDVDELFPIDSLPDFLPKCDVVVIAAPSTDETKDLFDAEMFALMKKGAIFCNISRGMHVVETALVDALESGHLKAAILDVTREEPLPDLHPLWRAPNLYLSPHCSISFDTYEDNTAQLIAINTKRFLAGETLENVVSS
jgi:phosphoglycerate dehydrogenase-like enzyme